MQPDFADTVPLSMVARINRVEREATSHWGVEFDELTRMAAAELARDVKTTPRQWWQFWKRRCGCA